ncbi:ABC transporter integral membrane protein [Candidatus Halobonum tyrrellensis G22]|uniref:ABC transporter integral membrane protein n=1 Tax=Candidatus Halobonum tyrrellensis G22 TaxID=1324957 RepID=V4J2X8_9EURY|nr:ABC transporter integral membrane protein [Candidatus Halobonum tyrrellensis G22]
MPYLLVFAAFLVYPLAYGFWMSLHDWNALFPDRTEFVGLANYQTLLADPQFWNALGNTVYFVVLTVPFLVVLSLLLALGVNRSIKGRRVLRTLFFSPYVLTVSVVGLLWQDVFETNGLIAYFTGFVAEPVNWLIDPLLAMPAVAIATIWWTIAFNFIILLAARQNVGEQLYEAARLDGATSWRAMVDITIPQMRNPMMFVVITSFLSSFQVFGQPYIMTDGGPAGATETIVMYLYRTGFSAREFGYAAAVGYVLFLVMVAVSLVNYFVLQDDGGTSA